MNLFEYLDTVPIRTYGDGPAVAGDVGHDPYCIVEDHPGNVAEAYLGHASTMTKLVQVSLYQAPGMNGQTSSRVPLTDIFNTIANGAPKQVTEDFTPGQFVRLDLVSEQAPEYDPKTKGLFGWIRFRLTYQRG